MIGLIVDGAGDYAAVRARYGSAVKVLKSDGPRGHTASEAAIIDSAKKQVALLKAFGCKEIAVLTDFEGRSPPWSSFCERAAAHAKKICGIDVKFIVADQMIENWLLADIVFIARQKAYLKKVKVQKNFESKHGKRELKKFFAPGFDYNEVRHSAELFPLVRGHEASNLSASFANFRTLLKLD